MNNLHLNDNTDDSDEYILCRRNAKVIRPHHTVQLATDKLQV